MPPLDESMVMVAFDEEAERYYQEAPPEYLLDLPMQDERHKPEEVAANLAVYESSLLPDPLPKDHPFWFYVRYSEVISTMDELELPPRLNPGQVPTARQVHQLLQRFSDTMKRRSAQENQKVFDKILELVDRIGTERKFEATGNTEIDERYAQHQMKKLSPGNTPQDWKAIISSLVRLERTDKAFEVFDSLESRGVSLTLPLFLQMWSLCKQVRDSEAALKYTHYWLECCDRLPPEEHDWLNVRTFNKILSAMEAAHDRRRAIQVFKIMQKRGVQPNGTTYSHMITIMIAEKKLLSALSFFNQMKADLPPQPSMYAKMIKACVHSGENTNLGEIYAQMLKIFEEFKTIANPNWYHYLTVMEGSALNRDVGTTFRMFEELQQRGIEVHAAHLMWLITACGTNWQVDKALSLFWTMEKQYGITPNPSCFNALLIALARSGRYDLLESNTLRAKNGYNTSICSKTVAFVLHSALQLEDVQFCRRFIDVLKAHEPGVLLQAKVKPLVSQLASAPSIAHLQPEVTHEIATPS